MLSDKVLEDWDYLENLKRPSEYTSGSKEVVHWMCKFGHRYTMPVENKCLYDRGCPICNASEFEKEAYAILDELHILYECEYTPEDLGFRGRFDIHVLKPELLIELDGAHHFMNMQFKDNYSKVRDVVARDNKKTTYAYRHNIPLLRVHYEYYKQIEQLREVLTSFIKTKRVPKDIIGFYKFYRLNNYGFIAELQNTRFIKVQQLSFFKNQVKKSSK